LIEDGGSFPKMASLAKHQENPDYAGWIWAVVEIPVERYFGPDEKICTIPVFIL
jgi:hypothetical protein